RALAAAGLEEPFAFSETGGRPPGQSVLLARAPAAALAGRTARTWLVLADGSGVGERLAQSLRRRGDVCALAFAGPSLRRRAAREYELPPNDADAMRRLL